MSKPQDNAEKPKEASKENHSGENKKPEQKKAETPTSKGKGHNPMPDGCHAWSCKAKAKRFNFCDEHYDHFKFGLIKKTGEQVSDYEKKIEHYLTHKNQSQKSARKVA